MKRINIFGVFIILSLLLLYKRIELHRDSWNSVNYIALIMQASPRYWQVFHDLFERTRWENGAAKNGTIRAANFQRKGGEFLSELASVYVLKVTELYGRGSRCSAKKYGADRIWIFATVKFFICLLESPFAGIFVHGVESFSGKKSRPAGNVSQRQFQSDFIFRVWRTINRRESTVDIPSRFLNAQQLDETQTLWFFHRLDGVVLLWPDKKKKKIIYPRLSDNWCLYGTVNLRTTALSEG